MSEPERAIVSSKDVEEWWNNEPTTKILNKGIIQPWDNKGEPVAYKIVSSQIVVDVSEIHDGLYLMLNGHGDAYSPNGHGAVMKLENEGGRMRLIVWNDINSEDCQVIWLDGALEGRRKED